VKYSYHEKFGQAEHLKTERRELSNIGGTASLDKLLALLEREPAEQKSPEESRRSDRQRS